MESHFCPNKKKDFTFLYIVLGTVCPDNFCTNGGTCFVNSFGDPTCLCPGDWTGAKCSGKLIQ